MPRQLLLTLSTMICLFGCSPSRSEKPAPLTQSAPLHAESDNRPVILAFGDSLTSGHGVTLEKSYPSLLQKELDRRGYKYRVVNAGLSGDTTSGGLARIDASLEFHPKIVVLELGANDGLRGLPIQDAARNLEDMIVEFQKTGARVILAGMTLPLNLGPDYIHDFESMYSGLSDKYKTVLIPFFLDGVAARAELNLEDGIHPNADGYVIVAETVFRYLEPLLTK